MRIPPEPAVRRAKRVRPQGRHARHAIAAHSASYEHIAPQLVGNERRVLVSELSGRSNIKAAVGGQDIGDDPKLMDQILARVVELENRAISSRRPKARSTCWCESASARIGRTSSG